MSDSAGSLLVRYGLLRREQVAEAERLRERDGGTLGECLIRLGIVDEERLVDFYHKRLMVPRLDSSQFDRVSRKALAAVPADMAAEFRVFPVELDAEGTLTLAMADPSDTHVVDEVMFFTDKFCQRAVAAESVIRAAIERHYGVRFASPPSSAPRPLVIETARPPRGDDTVPRKRPPPAAVEQAPADAGEEPVLLTRVKRSDNTPLPAPRALPDLVPPDGDIPEVEAEVDASDALADEDGVALPGVSAVLLTRRKAEAPPPAEEPAEPKPILLTRPVARDSRTPTLTGMPTVAVPDPPLARLRSTLTRDEIAATLLDYIAQMTPRVALFVVRKGALHGYDGRGSLDVEGVRRLTVSLDAPSLFRDVVQSRLPYRGPLPETPANTVFSRLVGALEGEVLLLPISVRDKVICLLYADGVATALPDAALHAVSREAGMAYERVILAQKSDR